jgi:hypothetical protein
MFGRCRGGKSPDVDKRQMSQSNTPAEVLRYSSDLLDVVTVSRVCSSKFYIRAHPAEGTDPLGVYESLAEYVH